MKRVGNLVEQIADYDNLCLAFVKAKRGKQFQKQVLDFSEDLFNSISELRNAILSGNISVGKFNTFQISDPKLRTICAASFDERVLHHALMNVCGKYFERHLISDTYATRIGKGQFAAIGRARKAFLSYTHVLKLDFRKYFDSISHCILKGKLARLFKDRHLLMLFDKIIDTYSTSVDAGLPIGNLTSQYFANFFLSDFDHFAKQHLHIPYYIRYMDDILVFADSRTQLDFFYSQLLEYSHSLGLTLKPPVFSTGIRGIEFLGYRLYRHKILLSVRSKKRFVRKYHQYGYNLESGFWTQEDYMRHSAPLFSFLMHAYSKKFRKKLLQG